VTLQQDQGRVSIPFLFDPNTGQGMFESADILDYLRDTYGIATSDQPATG
jgi:glutathione S-transferase